MIFRVAIFAIFCLSACSAERDRRAEVLTRIAAEEAMPPVIVSDETIRAIAETKGVTLTLATAAAIEGRDDYIVSGNESRIGQVFTNLVDNALSFSKPGARVAIADGFCDVEAGGHLPAEAVVQFIVGCAGEFHVRALPWILFPQGDGNTSGRARARPGGVGLSR